MTPPKTTFVPALIGVSLSLMLVPAFAGDQDAENSSAEPSAYQQFEYALGRRLSELERDWTRLSEEASERMGTAGETAEEKLSQAKERLDTLREASGEELAEAQEEASEAYEDAKEYIGELRARMTNTSESDSQPEDASSQDGG